MTTKLMSLGLAYLSTSGTVDIAVPLIERVAQLSGVVWEAGAGEGVKWQAVGAVHH